MWYGKNDDEPTLEQRIAKQINKQIKKEKEKQDDNFTMKSKWCGNDDEESPYEKF